MNLSAFKTQCWRRRHWNVGLLVLQTHKTAFVCHSEVSEGALLYLGPCLRKKEDWDPKCQSLRVIWGCRANHHCKGAKIITPSITTGNLKRSNSIPSYPTCNRRSVCSPQGEGETGINELCAGCLGVATWKDILCFYCKKQWKRRSARTRSDARRIHVAPWKWIGTPGGFFSKIFCRLQPQPSVFFAAFIQHFVPKKGKT